MVISPQPRFGEQKWRENFNNMDAGRKIFLYTRRSNYFPRLKAFEYRFMHGGNINKIDDLTHLLTETASLYVHWPFCKHICPYCNFNKYKSENVDNKRMDRCLRDALYSQIKMSRISKINSIFFGGGTPSLCDPMTIENLIKDVSEQCSVRNNLEVSLEANPSSDNVHKLRSFKLAGINRVSIGVQALNDKDLVTLGRDHTVQEAIAYINKANKLFDGRISIDLMFGRPGQTLEEWQTELKMALELNISHVSLYQLTMERSTQMEKKHRRGEIVLPDDDLIGDMYNAAVEYLEKAGLKRYEVANFAREGYESQHNNSYWCGQQYLGIGPGAHGRVHEVEQGIVRRTATIQSLVPEKWMEEVERQKIGMVKIEKLGLLQTLEEILLQGMRTKIGVNQEIFNMFSRGKIKLTDLTSYSTIKQLMAEDFLEVDDRGLRATFKGLGLLDYISTDVCLSVEDLLKKQH